MALAVGRPWCPREVNRPALGGGSWKDPVRHFNWGKSAFISFLSRASLMLNGTGPEECKRREFHSGFCGRGKWNCIPLPTEAITAARSRAQVVFPQS